MNLKFFVLNYIIAFVYKLLIPKHNFIQEVVDIRYIWKKSHLVRHSRGIAI